MRLRQRRGSVVSGCLTTILVLVAALYVLVHVGEPYYRYLKYRDAIRQEARFATLRNNDMIKQNIWANADSLSLPEKAYHVRITRTPRAIRIRSAYTDSWKLGPYVRPVRLRIDIEHPL